MRTLWMFFEFVLSIILTVGLLIGAAILMRNI